MSRTTLSFLQGGGEMGARMRERDWSATALGPPATWPQSLRSTVSMLLPSKAQIIIFWGPDFIVLYNDAYRPVFGAKHPSALGLPGRDAWREIWDSQLHQLLAGVVRTGEAFWAKDLLFEVERYVANGGQPQRQRRQRLADGESVRPRFEDGPLLGADPSTGRGVKGRRFGPQRRVAVADECHQISVQVKLPNRYQVHDADGHAAARRRRVGDAVAPSRCRDPPGR